MLDTLKTYLKERDSKNLIQFITENPQSLDIKDENGASGLMLIAYNGLDEVLTAAKNLKSSFSFHEAITCGNQEIVIEYLKSQEGSNLVNALSDDGFSPLSLAAFFNQSELAQLLLKHGADPNICATNPAKVNALHAAVAKQNYELCKLFIQNGVDVNAVQIQNVTALHSAVHRGNLKLTQLLVENGASSTLPMDNGDTPISIAKREGHHEIASFLEGIDH